METSQEHCPTKISNIILVDPKRKPPGINEVLLGKAVQLEIDIVS